MMQKVQRDELVDYVTYTERREGVRQQVLKAKAVRRIHVGDQLTLLFENQDTVRYQVQEMMRAEQIVKESDIQHELDTYNELLGGPGELGCTLMIEIDDPEVRKHRLQELLTLPAHIHAVLDDGSRVAATYDERQVGDDRVSSVQFLKFDTKGRVPVAFAVDHPQLSVEHKLTEDQRAALGDDLSVQ